MTNAQNKIIDIGQSEDLTAIQITYGMNGYPQGLGDWALIGFESFDKCEEFSQSNGDLEIFLFSKRDGHQLWKKEGWMNKPLTCDNYLNDLGDNHNVIGENDVEFFTEEAIDALKESDFEKAKAMIKIAEEIKEALENCPEDEIIIRDSSGNMENCKTTMMGYHEDVTSYSIGVFIPNDIADFEIED